jgi:hypothetical protein
LLEHELVSQITTAGLDLQLTSKKQTNILKRAYFDVKMGVYQLMRTSFTRTDTSLDRHSYVLAGYTWNRW